MICSNLPQDLAHLDFRQKDNLSRGSVVLKLHNGAVEDLMEHRFEVLSDALFTTISRDDENKLNTQEDGDEETLNELKATIDPENAQDESKDA
jgi:flagellar basal body-associated protein FliL